MSRRQVERRLREVGQRLQQLREELRIAGVPVGQLMPRKPEQPARKELGSILIVVATDAPLLPTQLERIAKRPALGLARPLTYARKADDEQNLAFNRYT